THQIFAGKREIPVENTPSQFVILYQRCWDENPKKRPDVKCVLEDLNRIKKPNVSELCSIRDLISIMSHIEPSIDIDDIIGIPDKIKLILRGSHDGFGKTIFFKRLKNIKNSILILRVHGTNEIIGGYNPLVWKELGGILQPNACYSETNKSFLFALKDHITLISEVINSKQAIYHEKGLGPSFGLDLYMVPDNMTRGESALENLISGEEINFSDLPKVIEIRPNYLKPPN
ncbi:5857_t:CDS:2, partial [Scutellospora calospora]